MISRTSSTTAAQDVGSILSLIKRSVTHHQAKLAITLLYSNSPNLVTGTLSRSCSEVPPPYLLIPVPLMGSLSWQPCQIPQLLWAWVSALLFLDFAGSPSGASFLLSQLLADASCHPAGSPGPAAPRLATCLTSLQPSICFAVWVLPALLVSCSDCYASTLISNTSPSSVSLSHF